MHYLATGETVRVSLSSTGEEARSSKDAYSFEGSVLPSISSDGAFVAFSSSANNLVEHDTNGLEDVFVRDIDGGETRRVSISSEGAQTEPIEVEGELYGESSNVSLSGDGSVVMFTTIAANLVAGDTNKLPDTFVHDMKTDRTERVSVSSDGGQVTGCTNDECDDGSTGGSISFDGRLVAFTSSGNLGARDSEYGVEHDVFIRDRATDRTILANHRYTGAPAAFWNLTVPASRPMGDGSYSVRTIEGSFGRTRGMEAFGWVFLQKLPGHCSTEAFGCAIGAHRRRWQCEELSKPVEPDAPDGCPRQDSNLRTSRRAEQTVRTCRTAARCPRQDSNLRTSLRRRVLYPLSYGGPGD